MLVRTVTVGFIGLLIAISIIASRGEGDKWWPFVHQIPLGDKLSHTLLFAILSLLCNLAFSKGRSSAILLPTTTTFILFWVVTLDESSQYFIPTRNFDPYDWLANVLGLLIGQILAQAIQRKSRSSA